MLRKLIFHLLLWASGANAAERVIINPDVDGNIKIKVNDGGVVTDAITVTGSDASTTIGVGVKLPSTGATPSTLNFYAESTQSTTFTWDGTGGGTSSTITVEIYRTGKVVTLLIPIASATTGTGSSTLTSNTAMPSWARPSTGDTVACGSQLINQAGSTFFPGRISITDAGIISFQKFDLTNFTNSVNVNSNNWSVCTFPI